jgi:hypothetical protein
VKEFDIFVPLSFNDGSPIPAKLFQKLQTRLLNRFDGLTFFPQPNRGFWKMGEVTYRDEIVIYRVLTEEGAMARRWLSSLKKWMKAEFQQEEILIVQRTVGLIP